MYLKQEKIDKIINEIYTELFKKAKPSSDFEELKRTGEAKKSEFFMNYYMSQDQQDKIMDEILKKHKIRGITKDAFKRTINLGCSPNTCKRTWKEHRTKLKNQGE